MCGVSAGQEDAFENLVLKSLLVVSFCGTCDT